MELLQPEKATEKWGNLTRITESQHPGGKEHRLKIVTGKLPPLPKTKTLQ